jgi:Ca2+-binding EF-hand superfamily protein
LSSSGIVLSDPSKVSDLIAAVDLDGGHKVVFEKFVEFATRAEMKQSEDTMSHQKAFNQHYK